MTLKPVSDGDQGDQTVGSLPGQNDHALPGWCLFIYNHVPIAKAWRRTEFCWMPTCRGSWMVQLKNLDPTTRRETPNCVRVRS